MGRISSTTGRSVRIMKILLAIITVIFATNHLTTMALMTGAPKYHHAAPTCPPLFAMNLRPPFSSKNGNVELVKHPRTRKTVDQVESEMTIALAALRHAASATTGNQQDDVSSLPAAIHLVLFPTTRECNAALATLGDNREFLRALRLFGNMRKSSVLERALKKNTANMESSYYARRAFQDAGAWPVPIPTLVTYSTLMSRLVKANKPVVALRLWNLMILDKEILNIDVKAANILMNCYAKVADINAATDLLEMMKSQHSVVLRLPLPNLITYNTYLSALSKAGDLDRALAELTEMIGSGISPDTRTYTSLIATVARRASSAAGKHDPTPAFELLSEMRRKGIQPNGMTYSALIDACGRCGRSDLALQGLRLMLQQKIAEQRNISQTLSLENKTTSFTLANEVGAWTAAINACGRSGRLKTALRIFYAMPNFGVTPNTVTCGSIMDSLLRSGWIAETLDLLRYMKSNGIRPTEVMYTSLMSRAEMLVQSERRRLRERNERHYPLFPQSGNNVKSAFPDNMETKEDTKAIEVYTELIKSLIDTNRHERAKSHKNQVHDQEPTDSKALLLLKVFLVFQQMKTAGAEPDLPCYNALLHACAKAGDLKRAQSVLRQMHSNNLEPNDTSWRLLLRAAIMSTGEVFESEERIRVVELVWKQALSYRRKTRLIDEPHFQQWNPSARSFTMLTSFYLKEAATVGRDESMGYYQRVIRLYEDILLGRNEEMGMNRIDLNLLLENEKAMIMILQAAVALDVLVDPESDESKLLRNMASSITKLQCFQTLEYNSLSWSVKSALQKSQLWAV